MSGGRTPRSEFPRSSPQEDGMGAFFGSGDVKLKSRVEDLPTRIFCRVAGRSAGSRTDLTFGLSRDLLPERVGGDSRPPTVSLPPPVEAGSRSGAFRGARATARTLCPQPRWAPTCIIEPAYRLLVRTASRSLVTVCGLGGIRDCDCLRRTDRRRAPCSHGVG